MNPVIERQSLSAAAAIQALESADFLREIISAYELVTDLKILPVIRADLALQEKTVELEPASVGESCGPRAVGEPWAPRSVKLPALFAREFRECILGLNSQVLCTAEGALVPPETHGHMDRYSLKSGNVRVHSHQRSYVMASLRTTDRIDKGISLVGAGCENWYHWCVEILPKLVLLDRLGPEYQDWPLLVPATCETMDTFRDSLDVWLGGRKIVALPAAANVFVERLLVIDSPVSAPFNMHDGYWPRVDDHLQHHAILRDFAARMTNALNIRPECRNRKLYLARTGVLRQHNQDELIEVARNFGFEPVYMERLTLHEQVALFAEASHIVGASGAGWTGLLYCAPGTKGLIWTFPQYAEFSVYSNLAHAFGVELFQFYAKGEHKIESTFDAYRANYEIDSRYFYDQLKRFMASEECEYGSAENGVVP